MEPDHAFPGFRHFYKQSSQEVTLWLQGGVEMYLFPTQIKIQGDQVQRACVNIHQGNR